MPFSNDWYQLEIGGGNSLGRKERKEWERDEMPAKKIREKAEE